ncbi:MAG TPA: serine hydrolase domain-containing protein [Gemmatimonadaceae bacterium]|nr:serine hydrolase domain-containing protein [Gemmatimonadaceae bacterium]
MPSYSATLLLLSLAAAPIRAQSPAAADTGVVRGQMGAALDQLLSRLAAYGLSGAMLVAKGDTVVLHRGYGLANRAANAPVAPETPFMIGSLSKQITAAAIVKLEAERKLATTDTLGKFFPGLPPEKARITLHQLLTHTAGYPYLEPNMFAEVSREQAVRQALELPLDRPPGERYAYANPGYTILAGVVERASGETFEAYLTKHLLEPAGMRSTGFMGEPRWRDARVTTHSYSDANDEGPMAGFPGIAKAVGAGSIITTAGDLFRWERALRGGALLPDSATRKLWAPHVPTGQGPVSVSYGYGWNVVRTLRNTTLINHGGDIGGYNADMRRYADEGFTVIFLSNARSGGVGYRQAVMNSMALTMVGAPGGLQPPAVARLSPAALRPHAGTYALPSGARLAARLDSAGGTARLVLSAESQEGISLLAGADSSRRAMEQELNALAGRVAEAAARGDVEPLVAALHPSIPTDGARDGVQAAMRALRDTLGDFARAEVVGTAVRSPGSATTYVRLHFARGSRLGAYGWSAVGPGQLRIAGIDDDLPAAMATPFLPESPTTLAAFDMFASKTVRATFSSGSVTIAGPGGSATARRVEEAARK